MKGQVLVQEELKENSDMTQATFKTLLLQNNIYLQRINEFSVDTVDMFDQSPGIKDTKQFCF